MRTREEIAEWLSGHICEDGEYCKIYSFLTKIGVESHWSFFRVKIDSKEIHNGYESFIAWFNEPNEKVEDEVIENLMDVYDAFIERCKTGIDVLLRPDDVKMGEKFIILPHLIYDNSYQQDLEINGKELKVTIPKFPIGTKVVRKSKPNGKVYTIRQYFTGGQKGVKVYYLIVADNGSFMDGVQESELERYEESSNTIKSDLGTKADDPKEGEFVHIEVRDGKTVTGQVFRWFNGSKGARLQYGLGYTENDPQTTSEDWHLTSGYVRSSRPATEEEKQTVIKAVEEKYNKTYCEETKQWVDVTKKTIHYEVGDVVFACAPYGKVIGELVSINETFFEIINLFTLNENGLDDMLSARSGGNIDFLKGKVSDSLKEEYMRKVKQNLKEPFQYLCDAVQKGEIPLTNISFQKEVIDMAISINHTTPCYKAHIKFVDGTELITSDFSVITWCSAMKCEEYGALCNRQ